MRRFLQVAWLVVRKDLRVESRNKEMLLTTLFFAVSCVLVFSFGFVRGGEAIEGSASGVLWITIAFSGTLALGRAFERERHHDALRGLLMAPVDRPAIYVGKLVGVLLLLAVVEALVVVMVAFLFQAPLFRHGWWLLTLSETLEQVPPTSTVAMPAGHLLSSNGADVMCTATRDGLVRWWESPQLASRRSEILKRLVVSERRRIDWEQRQVMFEAALTAEDEGMLTNAIELYQALGRTEDVRRLLGQQEQASAGG